MRSSWNPDHIPAPLTVCAIYDWAEDLSARGLFQVMDAQLDGLALETLPQDVLLALLTATLPVKSRLPARVIIYAWAKKVIHDPLKGLE